jgi:hypothetical protein
MSFLLAGCLWAVSVAGEIVFTPQEPDGSVVDPVLFALLVAAGVVGSLCLVNAFRSLRMLLSTPGRTSSAVRVGAWCCLIGAALLAAFSIVALVSGVWGGAVWEPSFIAFALGMLLLLAGQITLGLSLRRRPEGAGGVWPLLLVGALCVVVAIVVPIDPWHDVGMLGLFASWVALGARLRTTTNLPVLVDRA